MKKLFIFFILNLLSQNAFSWGFWAHKKITSEAIKLLPKDMRSFYEAHKDSIVNGSIAPDLRRNSDKSEAPRHYIDFEYYDEFPFSKIPLSFDEAKIKYGDSLINASGNVAWYIAEVTKKLEEAFRKKDTKLILLYSSDLSHYIEDAHVPLHTTKNYDGQLSNQHGLHARWESEIPERFNEKFKLVYDNIKFIGNLEKESFSICMESYKNIDKMLKDDKDSWYSENGEPHFTESEKNGKKRLNFNKNYYDIYFIKLNGMVEKRMEDATSSVASFWYTAWMNANKPILE